LVETIADAELERVLSGKVCVESDINVIDIEDPKEDSEVDEAPSIPVGNVPLTDEVVDIDGPVLSELIDISVVEITETVGMDPDETEAVLVVSLEDIELMEMSVVLNVSCVPDESDDGATDSIVAGVVDSIDDGVLDVG
jgi:hypothetical protein